MNSRMDGLQNANKCRKTTPRLQYYGILERSGLIVYNTAMKDIILMMRSGRFFG